MDSVLLPTLSKMEFSFGSKTDASLLCISRDCRCFRNCHQFGTVAFRRIKNILHMRLFAPFANTGLIGNMFVRETIIVDVIKWNNEAYSFLQYLIIIKY